MNKLFIAWLAILTICAVALTHERIMEIRTNGIISQVNEALEAYDRKIYARFEANSKRMTEFEEEVRDYLKANLKEEGL